MITCKGLMKQFEQSKLTQVRFAIKCEVHPARVSRILNGSKITTNEIDSFCRGLKCQPGDLIEWEADDAL